MGFNVHCLNPGKLHSEPYIKSELVTGKPLMLKIPARTFRGCGLLWQHFVVFLPTITRFLV